MVRHACKYLSPEYELYVPSSWRRHAHMQAQVRNGQAHLLVQVIEERRVCRTANAHRSVLERTRCCILYIA